MHSPSLGYLIHVARQPLVTEENGSDPETLNLILSRVVHHKVAQKPALPAEQARGAEGAYLQATHRSTRPLLSTKTSGWDEKPSQSSPQSRETEKDVLLETTAPPREGSKGKDQRGWGMHAGETLCGQPGTLHAEAGQRSRCPPGSTYHIVPVHGWRHLDLALGSTTPPLPFHNTIALAQFTVILPRE